LKGKKKLGRLEIGEKTRKELQLHGKGNSGVENKKVILNAISPVEQHQLMNENKY